LFGILLVLMFFAVAFLSYDVAPQDKDVGLGTDGLWPSGRGHNALRSAEEISPLQRYE
jgi:hypothetical protein